MKKSVLSSPFLVAGIIILLSSPLTSYALAIYSATRMPQPDAGLPASEIQSATRHNHARYARWYIPATAGLGLALCLVGATSIPRKRH